MIENGAQNSTCLQIDKSRFLHFSTKLDISLLRGESKTQVMNFVGKRHAKLGLTSSPEVPVECQRHQYI